MDGAEGVQNLGVDGAAEAAGSSGVEGVGPRALESPRERLLRLGAQALTDPELLAVLLGPCAKWGPGLDVAEGLLLAGGGLKALFQLDPHELCAVPGLGEERATQLVAALELSRRLQRPGEVRPRLSTPEEVYRYLRPELSLMRREVFHVLCFNARNLLLRDCRVAEGDTNSCLIDPREVFAVALSSRATGIVLAHNHPAGDPEPSANDLALTRHLAQGARLLGVKLLDHVVVGDCAFTSMRLRGFLPDDAEAGERSWNSR
jgi:DNA repair protein RadC